VYLKRNIVKYIADTLLTRYQNQPDFSFFLFFYVSTKQIGKLI